MDQKINQVMENIREFVDRCPYDSNNAFNSHPFFSFGIIMDKDNNMVRITDENIEIEKEKVYDKIFMALKEKDYNRIIFSIHKPYWIPFIILMKNLLSNKDYSELLGESWVSTEYPMQNGLTTMIYCFESADRKYLMNEEEYKIYLALPNTIKIYRGIQAKAKVKALSWTLHLDKAKWFAKRFSKNNPVYEAEIEKKYVYAYFDREDEIVVNPNYLKKLRKIKVE
jgi:hypothetical protein